MRPNPKVKPIRLKGKAYTELRYEAFKRAGENCERCGDPAPFLIGGHFDLFICGHLSHIKSRGSGGPDTLENVRWLCYNCHIGFEHGPRW